MVRERNVCLFVRRRFIHLCFCTLVSEHFLDVNACTNPPPGSGEVSRILWDLIDDAGGLDTASELGIFLRNRGCRPTCSSFTSTRSQVDAALVAREQEHGQRGAVVASATGGASVSASSDPSAPQSASSDATRQQHQSRMNLRNRASRRHLTPG